MYETVVSHSTRAYIQNQLNVWTDLCEDCCWSKMQYTAVYSTYLCSLLLFLHLSGSYLWDSPKRLCTAEAEIHKARKVNKCLYFEPCSEGRSLGLRAMNCQDLILSEVEKQSQESLLFSVTLNKDRHGARSNSCCSEEYEGAGWQWGPSCSHHNKRWENPSNTLRCVWGCYMWGKLALTFSRLPPGGINMDM